MFKFRTFQFFAAIAFVGIALPALQAQEKVTPAPKEASKSLHESLLGAWALSSAIDEKGELKPGAQMKLFGLKHWVITQSNPETGELIYHHGGTYKLEGDTYEETVKFAAPSTKSLIGKTFKFKIVVDGDTYEQVGIGNPYSHKSKRLKAE